MLLNCLYRALKVKSSVSQGKPGAPGKRRPTQRRGSQPEPKPGQRNELRPKTRPSTRTKLKNVSRSTQTLSLLKRRKGQQKVGTSFLLIYTLFTQCPRFVLCSIMLYIQETMYYDRMFGCLIERLNDSSVAAQAGVQEMV